MNYSSFLSVLLMCCFSYTTANLQPIIHNGSDLSKETEESIVGKTLYQLIEKFGQPFQIKNDTLYFFSLQRTISFWKVFGSIKEGIILKIKLNKNQEVISCEFITFKNYQNGLSLTQQILSLQNKVLQIDNKLAAIKKANKEKHLKRAKREKAKREKAKREKAKRERAKKSREEQKKTKIKKEINANA